MGPADSDISEQKQKEIEADFEKAVGKLDRTMTVLETSFIKSLQMVYQQNIVSKLAGKSTLPSRLPFRITALSNLRKTLPDYMLAHHAIIVFEAGYVAVIARKLLGGSNEEILDQTQSQIKQALDTDNIWVESFRTGTVSLNMTGFDYASALDRYNRLEDRLARIEEKIEDLRATNTQYAKSFERLNDRLTEMSDCPDIRERFIAVHKRNRGTATPDDLLKISVGNKAAHGGNIEADAQLYGAGKRKDYEAFEELYGVHPSIVSEKIIIHAILIYVSLFKTLSLLRQ
ncbi:hypothetical protein BO70DRAFT_354302 [Aspergillus heteromorphus CBS 117.55]|uniref:Uncharacterized protein n=1 Tax=Aspergillus heteromorphus CBS 117.55 TaxID=1448321 RepID=A0A317VPN1_9EURO|nr:uncharacterized protein BO70DRAFT_354302 [Aspergillus heteromorphus CBS 117.55]PWY76334.1 hypothetical protein BO70DRAFT_354302 [Aspergillus heteromorphus CBS 117.55]